MRRLPLRSPPRVRGKVCHTMAEAKGLGITPAYAGKSDPEKQPGAARWDHPRVCGEKKRLQPTITAQPGSPPRMRGKVPKVCELRYIVGITPAYAGKRQELLSCRMNRKDHPRVCGEKLSPTHA